MFKPPYAEDRTYGGVRGSGEANASHSLLDSAEFLFFHESGNRILFPIHNNQELIAHVKRF